MKNNTNYIKGFDTLRAYSIALVLLTHLGVIEFLLASEIGSRFYLLFCGGTGVQIFFTLSGFLITRILMNEKEKFGGINFKIFFIRRFLRLLPPLIIFYAVIAYLMYFRLIHTTQVGFLFSFFYLYNFVPINPHYTIELGQTWSLAVEEQFYLIWPFVLNFIKKYLNIIYLIIAIVIICIVAHYLLPGITALENFKTSRFFIPAVAPIMIGSLFAILNQKNEQKWSVSFHENKWILTLFIVLFIFPLYSPSSLSKLYYMAQPIGISIFLLWILYNQKSRLTSILNNKYVNYIGKISYGLYVYHGLFITKGLTGNFSFQNFPYSIILTFAVAIISYEIVEKPILRFKKRFTRKLD